MKTKVSDDVTISTVALEPAFTFNKDYPFETCVFRLNGSEVVAEYRTILEAVEGHLAVVRTFLS